MTWHMGIWPKYSPGDSPTSKEELSALPETLSAEERRQKEAECFDRDNRAFFAEINEFLVELQKRGRVKSADRNELRFEKPQSLPGTTKGNVFPFAFGAPQSVAFTLWWRDGTDQQVSQETPSPADIRVRVQALASQDHATIAIYIDAGKPWGQEYLNRGTVTFEGARRHEIVRHLEAVRTVAAQQLMHGLVDLDRLPEYGVDDAMAKRLLDAADYLYKGIWDEFTSSFGLRMLGDASGNEDGLIGERFSESRGLVFSVEGLDNPKEQARQREAKVLRQLVVTHPAVGDEPTSPGTIGLGNFPVFDNDTGEPNAIVKALMPFIRRVNYKADDRDLVACGILSWRALFISALGSSTYAAARDESPGDEWAAPGDHLPSPQRITESRIKNRPTRHLFVTKGEPHRMQIGRFVERVNAAESLRLFALNNWRTIQNAGVHIRILSRELDGILEYWSRERLDIDRQFGMSLEEERRKELNKRTIPKNLFRRQRPSYATYRETDEQVQASEVRLQQLSRLIAVTESSLISIGAGLDNIGNDGAGRLLFLLSRSSQFIDEFDRLLGMIDVGDIQTWLNYRRFIDRGLRSTFDVIRATEERLVGLRGRLQSITDVVQTGALIVEAEATRSNTFTLKQIARNWKFLGYTTLFTVMALLLQAVETLVGKDDLQELFKGAVVQVWSCLRALWAWLVSLA